MAFSPTGRFLVSGGGHRYLIWETHSGKMFGPTLPPDTRNKDLQPDIRLVRFSPDDQFVLTAVKPPETKRNETPRTAKVFQLWNATTGKSIGGFIGPELPPDSIDRMQNLAVVFTPQADALLIGYGKLAHFWDTRLTQRIGLPLSFNGDISTAAFSTDGQYVLVYTHQPGSSELSIWPCPPTCPGDPAGIKAYFRMATGLELVREEKPTRAEEKQVRFLSAAAWEALRMQLAKRNAGK